MKKKEIKGLAAFELLGGLDDGMIMESILSEKAPTFSLAPKKRAPFMGFMNSGLAAAMAGTVVAVAVSLSVLAGLVLVGRITGILPPIQELGHDTQAPPTQTRPDIQNGVILPPVAQDPSAESSQLAVLSDGIKVNPKGYCVYISGQQIDADGELVHFDGDGPGAVNRLGEIMDEIPSLRTGGNVYTLQLPPGMVARRLRVFSVSQTQPLVFETILDESAETDDAEGLLQHLTELRDGRYIVVLNVFYSSYASENEYKLGEDEYAFSLTVDSFVDPEAPVRIMNGDTTYFLEGYTLEKIYYDAAQKKEIVQKYDGAQGILEEPAGELPTAMVERGDSLFLYLAPFYDLRKVTIFYGDLTPWGEMGYDTPLDDFSTWMEAGDYYFVITAVYLGTGESEILEFPIHIRLVEEPKE